jgi:hypothetical protein
MKDLNQGIANYAVGRFNGALFGNTGPKGTSYMDGYNWDSNFITEEQITIAAPKVYKDWVGTSALDNLNDLSRKSGFIGRSSKLFSEHFFPDFSLFGADITKGPDFGARQRYTIPMLMLWPTTHQKVTGQTMTAKQREQIWKAHNAIMQFNKQ